MDQNEMKEVYVKLAKWKGKNERSYVWMARQIGVSVEQLWNTLNGRSTPGRAVAGIFMTYYERNKFEIDHA